MATGGQVLLGGNRSSSAALRTLLLLCSEVRTVRARVLCSSSSGTHGAQPAAQSGGAPGGRRVPKAFKSFECEQSSVRGVKEASSNSCQGGKLKSEGQVVKVVRVLLVTISWATLQPASEVVSRPHLSFCCCWADCLTV